MTSVTIVSPDRVKGGFISESSSLWLKSSALVVQVPTTGEILTKVFRFFYTSNGFWNGSYQRIDLNKQSITISTRDLTGSVFFPLGTCHSWYQMKAKQ